jgi:hypothetical protein
MTLEYCVASARRLRELRMIAEGPSLRQQRAMARRRGVASLLRDVVIAGLVLLAGWIVGRVVS